MASDLAIAPTAMIDDASEPAAERQWPAVIALKHPIDFGTERIVSLSFRRGKMGDMKGIKLRGDDCPTDDLLLLASRMCNQPIKVLEMLDIDDAGEVTDIALDFYAKYLGSSGRSGSR